MCVFLIITFCGSKKNVLVLFSTFRRRFLVRNLENSRKLSHVGSLGMGGGKKFKKSYTYSPK